MISIKMEATNNELWPSVRIKSQTRDLLMEIKKESGISMSAYIDAAVREKRKREGGKLD